MEDRESDSREEVVVYHVFHDINMLARMVDDLRNVGANSYQRSSTENIVEVEECENIFPLYGAKVLNAYFFSKVYWFSMLDLYCFMNYFVHIISQNSIQLHSGQQRKFQATRAISV